MLTHVDLVQKFLGYKTADAHKIMEDIKKEMSTQGTKY